MLESRINNGSSEAAIHMPKKEQWALIYQHRAMEFQRAKSMQKLMVQQKRDNFKKQLDSQLQQKNSKGIAQKEEDKRYYEYISQKSQQMKEKEEKKKLEKHLLIKKLQEHNKQVIQSHVDTKLAEAGKVYNIEIGLKSELQKKQRTEAMKKDVIETLDKQKMQKSLSKEAGKQIQESQRQRNEQYQKLFQDRNKNNKKYEQNQNVYNYYRDIFQQKMKKDRQFERKIVDEVQQKKSQDQIKRINQELSQKQRRNLQMKDTLSKQIQLINDRKQQDKTNPEQSYSFINKIFRQKKPAFDKQQYSLYLEKQAEEQRLNKIQQRYMSQEEYRLNSNQLNKAVNGNYTFDNYQDRSMVTLGDKMNLNKIQPLENLDAEIVKNKLIDARNNRRNRSLGHQSAQLSPLF